MTTDNEKVIMRKEKVVKMFRENPDLTGIDIANIMGVSRQYVSSKLREVGEDTRKRQKEVLEMKYRKLEEEFIKRYTIDTTLRDMIEYLGASQSVVVKISERLNLQFRAKADDRKERRVMEILELREKGYILKEIGKELDVSFGYVSRIIRWGRDSGITTAEEARKRVEDTEEAIEAMVQNHLEEAEREGLLEHEDGEGETGTRRTNGRK